MSISAISTALFGWVRSFGRTARVGVETYRLDGPVFGIEGAVRECDGDVVDVLVMDGPDIPVCPVSIDWNVIRRVLKPVSVVDTSSSNGGTEGSGHGLDAQPFRFGDMEPARKEFQRPRVVTEGLRRNVVDIDNWTCRDVEWESVPALCVAGTIGSGVFGDVLSMFDMEGNEYAVKEQDREILEIRGGEFFERETSIHRALSIHPNVIRCLASFENDGSVYTSWSARISVALRGC